MASQDALAPGHLLIPEMAPSRIRNNGVANKVLAQDAPVHRWYRFVLSFPPHLVRDCLRLLGASPQDTVLDPFCGTGTTLVECKKVGLKSVGLEANPMAWFASAVKTDWTPLPDGLTAHTRQVAIEALRLLALQGINDENALNQGPPSEGLLQELPLEGAELLLRGSISPLPLHKALVLLQTIVAMYDDRFGRHEALALANTLAYRVSNLHFGPEVGVRKPKQDAAVVGVWSDETRRMADDLAMVPGPNDGEARVILGDAREIGEVLEPQSVDIVITSPPYPNEKDYTRTTRLESVILGLVSSKEELRSLKRGLIRSNTRGVYKADDDDKVVANDAEIERIASEIEVRRRELGKTSGFERLYPRLTKLYFGGMARHLAGLRGVLRPGARLGYVVGDQASYLRVMIKTGEILSRIARDLGYEVSGSELFRTRLATATRAQLKEEVLLLRWPG